MKTWIIIIGIALVALGAFVAIRGVNYSSQRSVMRIGDVQASVEERRAVPRWVGGIAILGGLILVGVGFRSKSA